MLGKINWYDLESRRGSIIGDDNVWYRIPDCLYGLDFKPGERVRFELSLASKYPVITRVHRVMPKPTGPCDCDRGKHWNNGDDSSGQYVECSCVLRLMSG